MKFLPESKKRLIWSVVLFVVSVAGIIYVNFFVGSANRSVVSREQIEEAFSRTAQPAREAGQELTGGLLPHGSKINTKILDDQRFTVLKPAPPISIDPQELGKPNLFAR